jgi:hypothetical protein
MKASHGDSCPDLGIDYPVSEPAMRPVFLSYAREDRKAAGDLARALESLGCSVWWDLRLSAGQEFDEEIDRRLREASAVVVLWSRASVDSRWVKAEADVGAERGVLIPAALEDVEAPLPYRRVHAADLTDWTGAADHQGVADIHSALERLSGERTPTGPRTTTTPGLKRRSSGLSSPKRWAIALLLSLVAVGAVWMVRQSLSSEDTVIVPHVIGMRLDEARLQLSRLGIHGPGERDENGEPFPEGTPDLETITRVRDLSPPPGSSISRDDPDLTLYLEFCNGRCEPTTMPPVEPETGP